MVNLKGLKPPVKRPAVAVAAIAVAVTYVSTYIGKFTVIIAAAVFGFAVVFLALKKFKLFAAAAVILAVTVNLCVTYNKLNAVRALSGKEVTADFVVTADSVSYGGYSFTEMKSLPGGALPSGCNFEPVYSGGEKFYAGETVTATVLLSDIEKESRKTYYSDGVYAESRLIKFSKKSKHSLFYTSLGAVRRYIVSSYFKYSSGDTAALLIAITMGDKSYLSDSLYYSIREIGVSHMIAVSGFHLVVVIGGAFSVVGRLVKNRFSRFALSLLAVLFFAGICGFTKSVMRAGSMFIFAAAAPLFNRDSDGLSSLSASVAAVLLVSPFALFSIGFNLSVVSTFALIYISPPFTERFCSLLPFRGTVAETFAGILLNSFFASLYTTPVLIKVFGNVSIVGLFANLFLNYIVTLALVFGALALLFSPMKYLADFMFYFAAFFSKAMIFIIKGFSELPVVSVEMGKAAYVVTLLIIAALTAAVYLINYLNDKRGIALYERGF